MFGIWRTLLAIEVVVYHLLPLPLIGRYAVFSFFVLSGFLMTEVVQRTYGYTLAGGLRYAGNRALRLLPDYWFALLVTLVLIATLGAARVADFHAAMTVPQDAAKWAQNLTMVFVDIVPRTVEPRLVPPTWALTVEICFYVLIGLGASRTRLSTSVWLGLSILYIVVTRMMGRGGGEVLFDAIPAGSLPFSIGALAWHYQDELRTMLARLRLGDARLLIAGRWLLYLAILLALAVTGRPWLDMFGNWLNILVSALIVVTLFATRPGDRWRRIDKAVGDYSYPIYLLHLQMGLLAGVLAYGTVTRNGPVVFAGGLALTLLLATICARGIDPVVERLRRRIKQT